MVKKLLPFYFSLLTFSFSLAQSWEPVGDGLQGTNTEIFPVCNLCVYRNKLYAGGYFIRSGSSPIKYIASWDGEKWDSLKSGVNGYVNTLFVYHNQLCVGGDFTTAGKKRVNYLARWIDTAGITPDWYNLGATFVALNQAANLAPGCAPVTAFAEYKNQLYLAGYFGNGGCAINHIGVLNNGKWTSLSTPKCSVNGDTAKVSLKVFPNFFNMELTVYNDKLCASGSSSFLNADGTIPIRIEKSEDVATWDSKNSSVSFLSSKNINLTNVSCLTVFNSHLYAGGYFHTASGKPLSNIAVWDGEHWSPLDSAVNGLIETMLVLNGKLYVGGSFDSAGGKPAHAIAVWDGNKWSPLGAGFDYSGRNAAQVNTLAFYNGELYAGGYFTSSGGKPVMNIARLKLEGTKPQTPKKNKNG